LLVRVQPEEPFPRCARSCLSSGCLGRGPVRLVSRAGAASGVRESARSRRPS
jgi:hypothetical protein